MVCGATARPVRTGVYSVQVRVMVRVMVYSVRMCDKEGVDLMKSKDATIRV